MGRNKKLFQQNTKTVKSLELPIDAVYKHLVHQVHIVFPYCYHHLSKPQQLQKPHQQHTPVESCIYIYIQKRTNQNIKSSWFSCVRNLELDLEVDGRKIKSYLVAPPPISGRKLYFFVKWAHGFRIRSSVPTITAGLSIVA